MRPIYNYVSWLVLLLASIGLRGQTGSSTGFLSPEAQVHFAAAQQAQASKDYPSAEKEYQEALRLSPGFAEVHMNLGLVYQLEGRDSEAMNEFHRALKLKPTLAGANFLLGVDYCKQGNGVAAISYLKAAVAQQPGRVDFWSWLATAQDMAGQWQSEVATLNRGLKLQPQNVDLLYLIGQAYESLGKEQVATLKKSAPDSVRAEQLVAESYASSNEWPSAVIHFQNALRKAPNLAGLHVELGEVYLHAGKLKQATAEFENELALNPNSLRALVRRGEAKLLHGETKDALHDWEKALSIDSPQTERILGLREAGFGDAALEQLPQALHSSLDRVSGEIEDDQSNVTTFASAFIASQNNKTGFALPYARDEQPKSCTEDSVVRLLEQERYSQLAKCATRVLTPQFLPDLRIRVASALVQAGEYESSLKILTSLPISQNRSSEASYWRARCYEKLATAAYLELYQSNPNSYRVHQLLGDLASTRDDDGKAIEEYRAAIALNPDGPNLHYSLGHLLWKDLKVEEGRVELEAELQMNPRHAGALHDLGNTFLLEHQAEKALPLLKRAEIADPANPDIHRDLGTAYTQLKDYAKAEAEYKIGVADDQDGSVHYKLAKVYQALGQKQDADREFAIYTSMNRESHEKLEKRGQRLADIEKGAD